MSLDTLGHPFIKKMSVVQIKRKKNNRNIYSVKQKNNIYLASNTCISNIEQECASRLIGTSLAVGIVTSNRCYNWTKDIFISI